MEKQTAIVEIRADRDSPQEIGCRRGKKQSESREMIKTEIVKFEVEEVRVRKLQNSN